MKVLSAFMLYLPFSLMVSLTQVADLKAKEKDFKHEGLTKTDWQQQKLRSESRFISANNGFDIELGGFLDFQVGYKDEDLDSPTIRDTSFQNDTEIHITAKRTLEHITFGGVIHLEADVTNDSDDEGVNSDKTYLFIESAKYGRIELGSNSGVEHLMKYDASTVSYGTGGIDGDFYDYVDVGDFLYSPDLLAQFRKGKQEDATKLTYITPIISGFQLGGSFAPDGNSSGTTTGFSPLFEVGGYKNLTSAALTYERFGRNFGVQLSATSLFGEAERKDDKNLASYAFGANIFYKNFALGGSYANWNKYTTETGIDDEAEFFTIGGSYSLGPVGVSANYLNSDNFAGEFENIVGSISYEAFKGFVPYLEVSHFDAENPNGSDYNEGNIILAGSELIF